MLNAHKNVKNNIGNKQQRRCRFIFASTICTGGTGEKKTAKTCTKYLEMSFEFFSSVSWVSVLHVYQSIVSISYFIHDASFRQRHDRYTFSLLVFSFFFSSYMQPAIGYNSRLFIWSCMSTFALMLARFYVYYRWWQQNSFCRCHHAQHCL